MDILIQSLKVSIHTLLESFGHNIEFNPSDYKSSINKTNHPNVKEVVIGSAYGVVKVDVFKFDGKSKLSDMYISFKDFTSSQHSVALVFLRNAIRL